MQDRSMTSPSTRAATSSLPQTDQERPCGDVVTQQQIGAPLDFGIG